MCLVIGLLDKLFGFPQVDMTKVNLEVIKPWITQRVTEILGFEDDVVIEFIFNQLEEKVMFLIDFPFVLVCYNFDDF